MSTTELPPPNAPLRSPGTSVRSFPTGAVQRIVDRFVPGAAEMISGERLALLGAAKGLQDPVPSASFAWNISLSMGLSMVGAFLLMLPTSWVYMATRQR